MKAKKMEKRQGAGSGRIALGMIGHLSVFIWALGMVMLAPKALVLYEAGFSMVILEWIYPGVWRQIFWGRRLIVLGLISLPPIFLLGEVDWLFLGVGISALGLTTSLQIMARFIVVVSALEGLTNAVEISALAGLLERFGLKGLGFSVGVALNVLPSLKNSCTQTWYSLKMRGG